MEQCLLKSRFKYLRYHTCVAGILLTAALIFNTQGFADSIATRRFEDFPALRNDLLEMIGSATTRVWLVSDFLTDGEVVAALYIAQYRKINVQVLLGQEKANRYMSRLTFLHSQGIPVLLAPAGFPNFGATALLIDEKLLAIDSDLDFMTKGRPYSVTYESLPRTRQFMASFADAVNQKIPVPTKPTRVAIRSQSQRERGVQFRSGTNRATGGRRTEDGEGTYYYGGSSPKRPDEVPGSLPKKTKWQLRLEKQFNQDQNNSRGPFDEESRNSKTVDGH
jgi:hypothetical protein